MGKYNYNKIIEISFSSSSSGMSLGSNKSVSEHVSWGLDGTAILERTEINGFIVENSAWNLSAEQAEEIRAMAERIDMASWGELVYEEDPKLFLYDCSSHAGGLIFIGYSEQSNPPYVRMRFDRRAVLAAGKGEDLKMMKDLLERIADPDKRANYEQRNSAVDIFVSPVWTCKCGTRNSGKFCTECGCKRP